MSSTKYLDKVVTNYKGEARTLREVLDLPWAESRRYGDLAVRTAYDIRNTGLDDLEPGDEVVIATPFLHGLPRYERAAVERVTLTQIVAGGVRFNKRHALEVRRTGLGGRRKHLYRATENMKKRLAEQEAKA